MIGYYLFPMALASCILSLLIFCRRRLISMIGYSWWIHIVGFLAIYILIVWIVLCEELLLTSRLERLDVNQDGFYNGLELTDEYYETLKKMTKDTARKFSIYTGIIYSAMITTLLFITDLVRIHLWDKYIKKTNALDI